MCDSDGVRPSRPGEDATDVDALVAAWCRWYDTASPADEWAEQELIAELIEPNGALTVPDLWALVLRLIARAPNGRVLGIIGAGPLEDLLAKSPQDVAAYIRDEAPRNQRLRLALSHLWRMPAVPEETYRRLMEYAEPLLDPE